METALAKVLRVGRERLEEAAAVREIQSACVVAECDAEGNGVWFDLRTAPAMAMGRVLAHVCLLESRGLLDRQPSEMNVVRCWERA